MRPGSIQRALNALIVAALSILSAEPLAAQSTATHPATAGVGRSIEAAAPSSLEAAAPLTVAEIMQGTDFVGTSPSRLRWSPDGEALYFVWKRPGEEKEGLYRVDRSGGAPERLDEEEALRIEPRLDAVVSDDRRRAAFADEGDLYLLDVRSGRERRLLSAPDRLSRVQMAPDGDAVYFVRDRNLYRFDVEANTLTQLTDIRPGDEPREDEESDQEKFLRDQQRELLRVFEKDSVWRARRWPPPPDTAKVDTPTAFYIGEDSRMQGYEVAPDGRRMAFTIVEDAAEARLAWVPDYVTEGGYTERAPRERTKVGDEQDAGRMGIMDLVTGEVTRVDHGQGDDRRVDLIFREWSPEGDRLVAIGLAFDFHDRWVLVVDAGDGSSRVIDHDRDEAWIGGPSWSRAGWLPGSDRVWFVSESSGFSQLYAAPADGGEASALTRGRWELIDVELFEDEEWFLVTSEPSPHDRAFYRMPVEGGDRERITVMASLYGGSGRGISALAASPDGERLGLLYAWPNRPPELFLQDNDADARPERITESTTQEFRAREWMVPEIVEFGARDGTRVPARLYRPAEPNGAAVIFVHGAGYLQNVHNWWSSYYREYMFHNLLAERGFTVFDIDYRGSAGYGRDWRTAIHRHMGGTDLTDQVDGARFLVESLGIDRERIGIYGGSYGGFITLMAMFREPEVFAAGAALRPVTDWAHYNHGYTARILGRPQDDPEAYRRSSPIYFAEGLQGALLMCHGMIDQNVHFQDTVQLAQRLIELGKENWEVAIYPKEDHGFQHAWSWTDEYRRILDLFERELL